MKASFLALKEPKLWALLISGTALTVMTSFLGAPFLRLLRNVYGAWIFWIAGLFTVTVLTTSEAATMALLVGSVWLCIGIFCEFEMRGRGTFWAGMGAVGTATLVAWQGPLLIRQWFGVNIGESVQEGLQALVKGIENNPEQKAWLDTIGISTEAMLGQVPSMLALAFLMSLAFSMILARRVGGVFRLKYDRIVGTGRLIDFKVPDHLAVVFILSFLLSFLRLETPLVNIVALNVLQFMVGLYFFQGLAVLETTFLIFRVEPLIKLIVYILIVAQLFFLLSLVGLADFWLDFRLRLRNWKLKKNKQNHGEQI